MVGRFKASWIYTALRGIMMMYRNADAEPVQALPGIVRRTLIEGKSMMICEFTLEMGAQIPTHAHLQEQVGYLVSGKIRVIVDGRGFELNPGDCYCVLSNVPHSAEILARSVAVDTFSPPREDYRV